jgi:hypothetical protein
MLIDFLLARYVNNLFKYRLDFLLNNFSPVERQAAAIAPNFSIKEKKNFFDEVKKNFAWLSVANEK